MIILGILCRVVRQVHDRALTFYIGYDACSVIVLSVILLIGIILFRQCCDLDCIVYLIEVVILVLQCKVFVQLVQLLHTGIFYPLRSPSLVSDLRLVLTALP